MHFDMHHFSIDKWIRVKVFPLYGDIFACIYNDVTKEYLLDTEIKGFLTVNPDMLCVPIQMVSFLKSIKNLNIYWAIRSRSLKEKALFLSYIQMIFPQP